MDFDTAAAVACAVKPENQILHAVRVTITERQPDGSLATRTTAWSSEEEDVD